jgi:hypothetical protein
MRSSITRYHLSKQLTSVLGLFAGMEYACIKSFDPEVQNFWLTSNESRQ